MSSSDEERVSRSKAAKLLAAFDEDLEEEFIEAILQTTGNINCVEGSIDDATVNVLRHLRKLSDNKVPKILKLLLSHGVDITKKNSRGQTVLHVEVAHHCKESFDHPIISAVLSAHVDHSIRSNPQDANGITHFHIACMAKHQKAIQFFLDSGVDVDLPINPNSPLFPGCTPLHVAVKSHCTETAEKLMVRGANVHSKDAEGMTPAMALINRNLKIMNCEVDGSNQAVMEEYETNEQMVHLLLASANNNNNDDTQIIEAEYGFSNFHAACTLDDVSVAKSFLPHVEDISRSIDVKSPLWPGYSALHFAAHFNADIFKWLLETGGNIAAKDAKGVTPLDICAQRFSFEDVQLILWTQPAWKDIVLSDGKTKLLQLFRAMQSDNEFASFLNEVDNVNLFVDKTSPLWPGYTLLHLAVLFSERAQAKALRSNGQEEDWPKLAMIEECMARGADVTVQDTRGATPLHLAFYSRKRNIVRYFLESRDEIVDRVDDSNVSHLHIACGEGMYAIIQSLVLNGADVNLATLTSVKRSTNACLTAAGFTPLHLAVVDGNVELAEYLLQHNADLNAVDEDGWSPVHCLMLLSSPKRMGKALFSHSAKLEERVVESVGLSHLHVACHVDSLEGVEKLIKLGSDVNAVIRCEPIPSTENHVGCKSALDALRRTDYGGFRPLNVAMTLGGSIEIARSLLEAGADILAKDRKGVSPLNRVLEVDGIANWFGNVVVAHVPNSADLQKRIEDDAGMKLLYIFAFRMDTKRVEELLNCGVDVNAKMPPDLPIGAGDTALHAWVYGSLELDYGNEDVQKTLKLLLDGGADVTLSNARMYTPLHLLNYCYATIDDEDTLSTVRSLLNSQQDFGMNPVNEDGVSHFHVSVRLLDVDLATKFLEHGVDVNQRVDGFYNDRDHVETADCTPLHLVAYGHSSYLAGLPARMQMIDLLLSHGADTRAQDAFGNTPLHAVAKNAFMREKLLEKFVRAGGDVDQTNNAGETAFAVLLKSQQASPSEVEFFLKRNCRVNVYNALDQTGLLAATLGSCRRTTEQISELCRTLFKSPTVKYVDETGRSAIHNVVSSRKNTVDHEDLLIEQLVRLGCDIDAEDQSGKTALHTAAVFKNARGVSALLDNGADINLVDERKKSAFDYAFDVCRCSAEKYDHHHYDVIKTMLIHLKKMKLARLDISKRNEYWLGKAEKYSVSLPGLEHVKNQMEKTKQINVGNSKLHDFLSETGAVAAYPRMPLSEREALDTFFKTDRKVLKKLNEVKGVLRLQYTKAKKRAELIDATTTSLWILTGIPLPELCVEPLVRCLSLLDVQNLIASTEHR